MTIEKFLHFLISHNATIIEALLGMTMLAVLFLSIRMFLFAKEPSGAANGIDMGQLEGTLKQILEKAGQVPSHTGGGNSEDGQRLLAEISNLKTELETRQSQIEALKATSSASANDAGALGLSEKEKAKLELQIQELQAKLSEYEIISEDIADLSFYKEQNIKLQKELETLKSGESRPVPVAVAAPASPVPPPVDVVKPEPEIVGKSRVGESEMDLAEPSLESEDPFAAAAAAAAPSEVGIPPVKSEGEKNLIDDDLMAEFAAAVEKQKISSDSSDSASGPSIKSEASATELTVDLGQMDMDKMMAEAAVIKTDVPEVDPEKALGMGLDENKLLQEAAALEGVTPEDKKLMGDFENFVKKSES